MPTSLSEELRTEQEGMERYRALSREAASEKRTISALEAENRDRREALQKLEKHLTRLKKKFWPMGILKILRRGEKVLEEKQRELLEARKQLAEKKALEEEARQKLQDIEREQKQYERC